MDLLTALDAATREFGRRLALVDDGMWTHATPCPGWDVRYLAAHVVGGNRFAAAILGGMAASDAIDDVMSVPQLGDDPVQAWETTALVQAAAFGAEGALERRVDHPLGEITAREFLAFRVFDITLHAWDLARSVGADEQLGAPLVDAVLAVVVGGPPGMGFGIAPLGTTDQDSSPQARLLDLTGRRGG